MNDAVAETLNVGTEYVVRDLPHYYLSHESFTGTFLGQFIGADMVMESLFLTNGQIIRIDSDDLGEAIIFGEITIIEVKDIAVKLSPETYRTIEEIAQRLARPVEGVIDDAVKAFVKQQREFGL